VSKLILFDFECAEHGLFEDLVHPHIYEAPCPKCNRNAQRQISAPRIDHYHMALSPSASPESIAKFDRMHRERQEKETRSEAEHGDYQYGPAAGAD
jgi:hypothetical protein